MGPDIYLILAALAVAFGGRAWFRRRLVRDERRRKAQAQRLPLQPIVDAKPGARVRISGVVARVIDRRLDGDVGAARLVFAGGEAEPLYIA